MPFQIANLDAFLASVKEAQRSCADLTVPLTSIGLDWMRTNQTIFSLSTAGPWADLSGGRSGRNAKTGRYQSVNSGYKAEKLKKWGFVYPILKASGALQKSLTQPGAPGSLFQVLNKQAIQLGTTVVSQSGAPYPSFLQGGTRKMAARPFMNIPALSTQRWILIMKTFLVGRLKKTGS